MKTWTDRALDLATIRGASYADIRIVNHRVQYIAVKNGIVRAHTEAFNQGFGVRVVVDGAWGFAGSSILDQSQIDKVTAKAIEIARASALYKSYQVDLGSPVNSTGSYRTPVKIDPWTIPAEKKIDLLIAASRELARPGIVSARADLVVFGENKTFANSEGAFIEQEFIETGGGLEATAVDPESGEVQKRSYPNSFGRDQRKEGWEVIEEMDLLGNAGRVGEEAIALLSAPPCPNGKMTIVLGPAQLALQVHESCGHPIELDRVFGTEASYAGTSFLTPEKLDYYRYGSHFVNLTADATPSGMAAGGLGTFGWDDEGVPAQRVPIVREGIFCGYLTSRETARQLQTLLGDRVSGSSGGAMRADGWNRIPLIRMTNVNLEPGSWTFDDLIADTDNGLYMETNKSWSIDDKRLNFQFGTEVAYEIKNGRLGRLFKNATYTGITPQFWANCDAICNQDHWRVWGTPNCGKGQPGQVAHTGHGVAPARFRNIKVGVR